MITELQERLATHLGDDLPPEWRQALTDTPRHLFLPDQALRVADGDGPVAEIDRSIDEQAWLEAAYSPDIIVTQRAEDGSYTSSCSMPYMVFTMLRHLDATPGMKALEIGAGTGWNAALLSGRLGEGAVWTVEVDAEIADFARGNLAKLGLSVPVMTGDGAEGWEPGAPYDRVIATCTVRRVPYAWVSQTRTGGVILTPWGTPLDNGALLKLTVGPDGSAVGRFVDTSVFMWLRSQRPIATDEPDDFGDRAEVSRTQIDVPSLFAEPSPLFAIGLLVPDCKMAFDHTDTGDIERIWLLSNSSWASISKGTDVHQLGPRRLWDEVESAHDWWHRNGKPDHTRFGVTVTRETQTVWLDDPGSVVMRR